MWTPLRAMAYAALSSQPSNDWANLLHEYLVFMAKHTSSENSSLALQVVWRTSSFSMFACGFGATLFVPPVILYVAGVWGSSQPLGKAVLGVLNAIMSLSGTYSSQAGSAGILLWSVFFLSLTSLPIRVTTLIALPVISGAAFFAFIPNIHLSAMDVAEDEGRSPMIAAAGKSFLQVGNAIQCLANNMIGFATQEIEGLDEYEETMQRLTDTQIRGMAASVDSGVEIQGINIDHMNKVIDDSLYVLSYKGKLITFANTTSPFMTIRGHGMFDTTKVPPFVIGQVIDMRIAQYQKQDDGSWTLSKDWKKVQVKIVDIIKNVGKSATAELFDYSIKISKVSGFPESKLKEPKEPIQGTKVGAVRVQGLPKTGKVDKMFYSYGDDSLTGFIFAKEAVVEHGSSSSPIFEVMVDGSDWFVRQAWDFFGTIGDIPVFVPVAARGITTLTLDINRLLSES